MLLSGRFYLGSFGTIFLEYDMNGYKWFYNDREGEVHADTSFAAQQKVATEQKVPAKRRYQITVVLAEKAGEPVVHVADF